MNRGDEIRGVMRKLEWDGYPRLQMSFFIIITGASGMVMISITWRRLPEEASGVTAEFISLTSDAYR